jgi:hypothetical protein
MTSFQNIIPIVHTAHCSFIGQTVYRPCYYSYVHYATTALLRFLEKELKSPDEIQSFHFFFLIELPSWRFEIGAQLL